MSPTDAARLAELRRYLLDTLDHPERIHDRPRAEGEGVVAYAARAVITACVVEMTAERMALGIPTEGAQT